MYILEYIYIYIYILRFCFEFSGFARAFGASELRASSFRASCTSGQLGPPLWRSGATVSVFLYPKNTAFRGSAAPRLRGHVASGQRFQCFCVPVLLSFCVSGFLCFCVSGFLGFCVTGFQGFRVSVFLCFCVSVFLCFCVSGCLCFCVSAFLCFRVSGFLDFWIYVLRGSWMSGFWAVSVFMYLRASVFLFEVAVRGHTDLCSTPPCSNLLRAWICTDICGLIYIYIYIYVC